MTANTAVAGQRVTAAWLNTNIPGPWQPITPGNNMSNVGTGSASFQARLFNSVTVEVIANLSFTAGAPVDGGIIGQLPSGMIPANAQANIGTIANPNTLDGQGVEINVTSTGAIKAWDTSTWPSTATALSFHIFVSLDA